MSARSGGQRSLFVLLLAGVGVLLADAFRYGEAVRLFPLVVLGALAAVVTILLLAASQRGFERYLRTFAALRLTNVDEVRRNVGAHGAGADADEEPEGGRRRIVAFVAWMLGLLTASAILGFLIAIPLFLITFLLVRTGSIGAARRALPAAVTMTLGTMLFVYVIFVLVLGLPLGRPIL